MPGAAQHWVLRDGGGRRQARLQPGQVRHPPPPACGAAFLLSCRPTCALRWCTCVRTRRASPFTAATSGRLSWHAPGWRASLQPYLARQEAGVSMS